MGKRTIAFLLVFALIIGALSGCSFVLSRDYLVITPHLEQHTEENAGDELRAETFDELKSGILHLIEGGADEGIIRLYNYSGNADVDAKEACLQITRNEPLGVYAVEYMSFKCVRILTYYEVTVSITYRRTLEKIQSIIKVNNAAEFQAALNNAYSNYESSLTAETEYYITIQYDIEQMLEDKYYSDPLHIAVLPSYSLHRYPDTGWRRILEVNLDYGKKPEALKAMTDELYSGAYTLLTQEAPSFGMDEIIDIHRILIDHVEYMPDKEELIDRSVKDETCTAYGAIIHARATSEGYALAFKSLCDMADVECVVVRGHYNGLLHYWNMVNTSDGWYHIDTALDDLAANDAYLFKTDAQMKTTHQWTTTSYPSANSPEYVPDGVEDTAQDITGTTPAP